MAQKYAERPHFYEGQYLGADEFNNLQDYLRDKQRRHLLGAHSWGVVAGLELREQASGSDTVVYLQPGHAVDGYGRAVTLTSPYQVSPELFGGLGNGLVKVWLHIREVNEAQHRTSFDACCGEDCFEAVAESFELEVGDKDWLDDRHSGVDIAGSHVVDPREIVDDDGLVAEVACDASNPFQEFPQAADKPNWLIPLGLLMWDGSRFVARSAAQRVTSRAFRRPAGLIGENLFAADGLLRLRGRRDDKAAEATVDEVCNALAIRDRDVTVAASGDDFDFNELVWIEGDLRITGDARLFGTRLEFRDDQGAAEPPLYLRRGATHGADLEVTLGEESASAVERDATRLVVGTESDSGSGPDMTGKFFVTANGKVGVGTGQPQDWDDSADALVIDGDAAVGLTIAGSETGSLCFATGTDASRACRGRVSYSHGDDSLVFGAGNADHVWLSAEGRLGIGTSGPSVPLHVASGQDVTLGNSSGFFLLGDTGGLNIVMDNNEIQARNAGGVSTLHLQAEGGNVQFNTHQAANRVVVTDQGRVGIGTNAPLIPLQITNGRDSDLSNGSGYLLMGETGGENMVLDNNEIQVRNNGSASPLYLQKEGGELRIGLNGRYHAVGSRQANLNILGGRVSAAGNIQSGSGFSCNPPLVIDNRTHYVISFTDPYTVAPAVIVSASDPNGWEDNLANAYQIGTGGFTVVITDNTANADNNPESSEFNFIVIGI